MNAHSFNLVIISSYFDFDDYKDPIHYYFQDFNQYSLNPNIYQTISYRVRRNRATLNDNIWFGAQGSADQIDFYSVKKDNYVIDDADDQYYIQIEFSLDVQFDQYQRTVFSVLDLFGYIGGLFQIFKLIGFVLVNYFTGKSFYCSVLSRFLTKNDRNKKAKYNFDIKSINKMPEVNEEEKSYIGFNINQNQVVPSKFDKRVYSANLNKLKNISEEFKFKENINYQDVLNIREFIKQVKENNKNVLPISFIQSLNTKETIEYSIKDQLFEILWLHKWKSK